MTMTAAVWLFARICLVAMFPFSAVDKIWHWKNSLAQTDSAGLPGGRTMLVMAIAVEGLTPFFIVFGVFDRPAAFLLAGFCFVTAFLYHPFWKGPDFFSPRDDSVAREHFWQFLKNFGLVGGLLLVVFAGSLVSPGAALEASSSTTSRRPSGPVSEKIGEPGRSGIGLAPWLWRPASAPADDGHTATPLILRKNTQHA